MENDFKGNAEDLVAATTIATAVTSAVPATTSVVTAAAHTALPHAVTGGIQLATGGAAAIKGAVVALAASGPLGWAVLAIGGGIATVCTVRAIRRRV